MNDSKSSCPQKAKTQETSEFFNGFGGFVDDGREYEIIVDETHKPPAPWINVIANKTFGFTVSEAGAGLTWSVNSRENKITPWSNDPVSDRSSEALYIRDEISAHVSTPTSLGRKGAGEYRVRHGFGYSVFTHQEDDLEQELLVFVPLDEPIKLWRLTLKNTSRAEKYLSLYYYVEWVFGVDRELTSPYIISTYNNEDEYLSAKSIYNYDFRNDQGFIFSSEMITEYTGDKREFFGRKGSIQKPLGLAKKLSYTTGVGYDPCGVIKVSIALKPGETKSVVFGLGQSSDRQEIRSLRHKYRDLTQFSRELARTKTYWADLLGKTQVKTSDRALDILVNGWLVYQTIACRINARAAFYQCGGAYGFRDQLQDVLAILDTEPQAVKQQIMTACSRQFEEGDVQHWWHPPTGVGVRTRISDDLLWLPYVTSAYITSTGDVSVLNEKAPYIKGEQLQEGQHEIMFAPQSSEEQGSVYEHCKKTILRSKFGRHGLPLMGGGDWNDGMNRVGIEGQGESVWLGWFLYEVLGRFIPLSRAQGDTEFAVVQERMRHDLQESLEAQAWDGEWYLRAFYDDGEKIGSKENDECKIDSISQSWSVISQAAEKERAAQAVRSAQRYLVNEKEGLSLLLTPPFDQTPKNPGYIKNYYPGIRENGAQYTHAAVWLAIAAALSGAHDLALTLFTMLNPIHTTATKQGALKYEKEPYVMAADIYSNNSHAGRGGWSWYTGSAGWMYQGLVRTFLGLRKEGTLLIIDPATPAAFGDYTVWYTYGATHYEIRIQAPVKEGTTSRELILDGRKMTGNKFELSDDGKAHVVVSAVAPC